MRGVTKTIVIGLGGTGLLGVLYAKKQLEEVYGEVPPTFKFLVFDTAPQTPLQLPDREIKLEDGVEFHHLTVERVKNVIKHEDIAYWFDPNIAVASIKNGAGQKRHVGRVSLFRHYNHIRSYLEQAAKALTHFSIDERAAGKYFLADESISVYIITSIAGGTGAGSFLDLGFICRDVFPDNTTIRSFLVLPDIYYNGAFFTDRVNMNAYGSLLELDQWMNISRKNSETYWIANDELAIDEPPFDWVIFVGDKSRGEVSYDSPRQLAEMIGLSVFTLTSQVGESVDSVWDNAKDWLDRSWKGKKTKYCGLGVAELVYDPERVIALRCRRQAKDLILELTGEQTHDIEPDVEQFIDLQRLRETKRDDVIDAILEPGRAMPYKKDFTKSTWKEACAQCEQWLAVRELDYRKKAKDAAAKLSIDKSKAVEDFLMKKLHAPGGPAWTMKFLERIVVYLDIFKSEVASEKGELLEQSSKLKKERALLTNKLIPEAAKRLFGKSLEESSAKFRNNLSRASLAAYEMIRRDAAVDFYTDLIGQCQARLDQFKRLREKLEGALNQLTEDVIKLERPVSGSKLFTIAMAPDDAQLDAIHADAGRFLEDLSRRGVSLLDLAAKKHKELLELINDYVNRTEAVESLRNKSLDQVFADMLTSDEAQAQRWIKALDEAAEPLMRYNDDLRPGDEHKPQTLYCMGVESSRGSILAEDPRLKHLFKSPKPPSVAGTNDPHRIIVLKLEAAIPAFALENVKKYREDYMKAKRDRSESVLIYHSSKAWYEEKFKRFEGVFDLLPVEDENEDRRFWALGLALGTDADPLIFHRANNYFLYDKKLGQAPDYEVQLGNSRRKSRDRLLTREDYLDKVKQRVDKMIKTQGAGEVKKILTAYLNDRLRPKIPARQSRQAELRQIMIEEAQDLETYIALL